MMARLISNVRHGRSWAGIPIILAVIGAVLLGLGVTRQQPAPPALSAVAASQAQSPATTAPQAQSSATGTPAVAPLPPSRPVSVNIPSLGVSASTLDLGLLPDRTLSTPPDGTGIGWYTGSPTPGTRGPSILAAHVTWDRQPGVFFRLAELRPGDRVEVERQDGRIAVFAIDRVVSHPKDEFPTAEVYDGTLPYAGLRLITCAGEFDERTKRYHDNVIAYASLVGEK